jgi:epsilon-lactone hydrolase
MRRTAHDDRSDGYPHVCGVKLGSGVVSWQMSAIAAYLRLTRKSRFATASRGAARLTEPKGSSAPPAKLTRRCDVTREAVEAFGVYTVRPKQDSGQRLSATVVYLHGGAYVSEIQPQHWALIAELAIELGCRVVVPIYGLAPAHTAEEAVTLMHSVLGSATAHGPTYLVGDSAGGGLALSAALSWQAVGGPKLQGLTLIAPWLDLSLSNPAIASVEPSDPWLSTSGLAVCAEAWRGPFDVNDPRVSPIYGTLADVPPIDLYVGDRDVMVSDCRLLRDRIPAERLGYNEEPGAVHVYPLLPAPEGRAARRQLIAHIRDVLGPTAQS